MSDESNKKINIIFLKRILLEFPKEELSNIFSTKEQYTKFITILNDIIEEEPEFFLIADELITRAEATIEAHRFTYTEEETIELVNYAIVNLNKIKGLDEKTKQARLLLYRAEQETMRHDAITSAEMFVSMQMYDAEILEAMLVGKSEYLEPRFFIGSTNYLIETIPELYCDHEELRSQTITNMETITSDKKNINFFMRAYAKRTIRKLQKIKTKEE